MLYSRKLGVKSFCKSRYDIPLGMKTMRPPSALSCSAFGNARTGVACYPLLLFATAYLPALYRVIEKTSPAQSDSWRIFGFFYTIIGPNKSRRNDANTIS